MLPDLSGNMSDEPRPNDLPAFDGGPTDITKLLKGLLDTEVYSPLTLAIATDGEESSQNVSLFDLLKEFDIIVMGHTPGDDMLRQFVENDEQVLGEE
jgi:hypothetical protein